MAVERGRCVRKQKTKDKRMTVEDSLSWAEGVEGIGVSTLGLNSRSQALCVVSKGGVEAVVQTSRFVQRASNGAWTVETGPGCCLPGRQLGKYEYVVECQK